jgi:hypothetical protein
LKKGEPMKKLMIVLIILLFSSSLVYAGGGKVRNSKGQGSTHDGDIGSGKISQPRTGR